MSKLIDDILSYTVDVNGCMEWTRCFNTDGYPRMTLDGNVNIKVHRQVYALFNGEDISGRVVRHTCDNKRCINPQHLILGNNIDNVRDRVERERTYGHVPTDQIEAVRSLRESGFTYLKIAKLLGIKYKRVEYIVKRKFA